MRVGKALGSRQLTPLTGLTPKFLIEYIGVYIVSFDLSENSKLTLEQEKSWPLYQRHCKFLGLPNQVLLQIEKPRVPSSAEGHKDGKLKFQCGYLMYIKFLVFVIPATIE